MKRLLSNPNKELKPINKNIKKESKQSIIESASEMPSDIIEEKLVESLKNSKSDIEILKQNKEQKNEFIPVNSIITETPEVIEKNKNITKEECTKILDLLRTPTFNQIMNLLTVKESVIISLKLGYIDGKYFSTDSIAQFLGIEQQEVLDTTKKVLLLYKENINQFIDDAIEMVTEQPEKIKNYKKS